MKLAAALLLLPAAALAVDAARPLPKPSIPAVPAFSGAAALGGMVAPRLSGPPSEAPALAGLSAAAGPLAAAQERPQAAAAALDAAFDARPAPSFGAELASPNPVSATTIADSGAVSRVFVDASRAERGQLSALVKAVRHAGVSVTGRFSRADDPTLKPKLDEGLLGAMLAKAESFKETLRFLRRLYLPPLGERTVGPSDATGYLRRAKEFIAGSNRAFQGGVQIATEKGARGIERIVRAKARGLRFIELDTSVLSAASIAKVEAVAKAAGVGLYGFAASRAQADALVARGYAHVTIGGDAAAVEAALARYRDAPEDAALEPAPGSGPRDWIARGRIGQLGFLNAPDPTLARIFSDRTHALWIDAEGGPFSPKAVAETIAALPPGRPVVVRAAEYDDDAIPGFVRAGAAAVVAPTVANAAQARAFVAAVKRANPAALAIVMIETRAGLRAVEEIAAVPGVDLLFIGPNDLALSLGLDSSNSAFAAAIARIEAAARAAKVPLGGLARSRSQAYALHARGYRLVATVMDQVAISSFYRRAAAP